MANLDLNLRELVRKSRQRLTQGREAASVRLSNLSSMSVVNLLEATTGRGEDRHRDQQGWSVLHVAARHSKPQTVRLVIDQGGRVSGRDFSGNTPLHLAAEAGNKEAARVLLHHGANVPDKNSVGLTCLHVAVRHAKAEMVPLLLQYTVNVDMLTTTGQRTALHIAASQGLEEIGKILMEAGANPRAKASLGWTPLHFSCREGRLDMTGLLITKGGKIDAVTTTGWTPLMFAASYNQTEVAKLLVAKRARTNLTNRDGLNAMDIARGKGNAELAQMIRGSVSRRAARQEGEERGDVGNVNASSGREDGQNTSENTEPCSSNDCSEVIETNVDVPFADDNIGNETRVSDNVHRLNRRLETEILKLEELRKKKDEEGKRSLDDTSECDKESDEANRLREDLKRQLLKVETDIQKIEQKKSEIIEETKTRRQDADIKIKNIEEEIKHIENDIKSCIKEEAKANVKIVEVAPTVDVQAELECPVCFELSKPPIFQCPEGHIICNTCRPKVSSCPVCRFVFKTGLPEIRNRYVERLSRSYFNLD